MATETQPTMTTYYRGSYGAAFWAGVLGALMITVLTAIGRAIGLTPMNLELYLGTMFSDPASPGAWSLGFLIHLVLGGVFGLVYAAIFRSMGRASTALGTWFGAIHWVAAGIFLGLLPAIHPRVPELLGAPGFFAVNVNFATFVALLAVHLLYGALVGAVYSRSVYRGAVSPLGGETHVPTPGELEKDRGERERRKPAA